MQWHKGEDLEKGHRGKTGHLQDDWRCAILGFVLADELKTIWARRFWKSWPRPARISGGEIEGECAEVH